MITTLKWHPGAEDRLWLWRGSSEQQQTLVLKIPARFLGDAYDTGGASKDKVRMGSISSGFDSYLG